MPSFCLHPKTPSHVKHLFSLPHWSMCFVLRGPTDGSSFPLPLDLECGHETMLANYLLCGGDLSAELKDSLDIAKSNR